MPIAWEDEDFQEDVDASTIRCTFCDKPVDDRRFAVELVIYRMWSPGGEQNCFCHIECLRRAMHPSHKIG
jgi:hypothetical protein